MQLSTEFLAWKILMSSANSRYFDYLNILQWSLINVLYSKYPKIFHTANVRINPFGPSQLLENIKEKFLK